MITDSMIQRQIITDTWCSRMHTLPSLFDFIVVVSRTNELFLQDFSIVLNFKFIKSRIRYRKNRPMLINDVCKRSMWTKIHPNTKSISIFCLFEFIQSKIHKRITHDRRCGYAAKTRCTKRDRNSNKKKEAADEWRKIKQNNIYQR